MQVTYQGFTPSERTLAVDESDLAVLYDLLRRQFLKHVEFGRFDGGYVDPLDKEILALCARYDVVSSHTPDRLAFFKALLGGDGFPPKPDGLPPLPQTQNAV